MKQTIGVNNVFVDAYNKKEFTYHYTKRKAEGFLDCEIRKEMGVPNVTFTTLKALYGLKDTERVRRNNQGVTEEQLQKGESIGLTRRIILRRVREGWSVDRAIHEPKELHKMTHRRKRK
jgi:hypothetical protein